MSLTRCCSGASRKSRLIWTVTRLFDSPFDPAVETTESIVSACCHNCAEIKADVDVQVLSHAERDIRCLGIASSDADGKWFSVGNLTFSDPPRPDTKDVIFGAGELGIQVKMITGDHVAIAKETCRVIGVGTKIPTTKDTPANKADTLRDRFGELVEGCDGFAGVHLEHKFQIVQVLKSRGRRNGMTGDGVTMLLIEAGERRYRRGWCCSTRRCCNRSYKPGAFSCRGSH